VVGRELVVARCGSTTLLDPVEEAVNDIAGPVELWAETGPSPANEAVVVSGVETEHIRQLVSVTLLRNRHLGRSTTETDFFDEDCTTQRAKLIKRIGVSSYRVYEYTACRSWPARIIPHAWEIRTRCAMGSRNFSRGFVRWRAGSNFGNNSFHRCRRFYEAGSIGNGGELVQQDHVLVQGVGAVPWPGGERGGGSFPDRF
jgi:hypothetical protein